MFIETVKIQQELSKKYDELSAHYDETIKRCDELIKYNSLYTKCLKECSYNVDCIHTCLKQHEI